MVRAARSPDPAARALARSPRGAPAAAGPASPVASGSRSPRRGSPRLRIWLASPRPTLTEAGPARDEDWPGRHLASWWIVARRSSCRSCETSPLGTRHGPMLTDWSQYRRAADYETRDAHTEEGRGCRRGPTGLVGGPVLVGG